MDMLPRQEQAKLAASPGSCIVTGSSSKSGKEDTVAGTGAVQRVHWISKSPQSGVHQNPLQLAIQLHCSSKILDLMGPPHDENRTAGQDAIAKGTPSSRQ
ncbi:hypothetical protein NL676_016846 [Syzygium grande]|nr:hypothetical protein NL676_016846 [Syzygium grande]